MPPSESNRFCVSDLLLAPVVLLNLTCLDRDTLLAELVAAVPELQSHPDKRDSLLKALREREDLHSTGIGDGVALPHARTALSGLVSRPVIIFGRHPKGIAFGAIDRKPVHLFFLLVTTSVTQHLQILARISRLLQGPLLRQQLLTTDSPGQILTQIRNIEQTM
jgi:mannitol/fructose-specific phosphotransferase system IIA component (Ntr-type)